MFCENVVTLVSTIFLHNSYNTKQHGTFSIKLLFIYSENLVRHFAFFFFFPFRTVATVPSGTVATVVTFFCHLFVLFFIYIVILTQQISQYFYNY